MGESQDLYGIYKEKHGKTMGKRGKTMGKPWKTWDKPWKTWEISGKQTLEKNVGRCGENHGENSEHCGMWGTLGGKKLGKVEMLGEHLEEFMSLI